MAVDHKHPEYEKHVKRWEKVRDCVEGDDAVKERRGTGSDGGTLLSMAGTRYLPPPNPDDNSLENKNRYVAYRKRANFVNFTGMTKEGMLGMIFRKEPMIELPTAIEYLKENADGAGQALNQELRDIAGELMEAGRLGVLVDYPQAPEGLTQAEVKNLGLRASFITYPAESIINWRMETVAGVKRLSMVVLAEKEEVISDDGFGSELKDRYRVLRIDDGTYIQQLYDEEGKNITDGEVGEDGLSLGFIMPRKFDGSAWSEIPFVFIGAQNNDETIDKAPLYDIANVNLAHYRNSADYEESCFMVGQPTPVLSGLTQAWVEQVYKDKKVYIGSRSPILLPEGGRGELMQADPNQMPSAGMEAKEKQIVSIGARIIQDQGGVETAEAARIRYAGQNSKLGVLVGNMEEGVEQACVYALMFMASVNAEADNGIVIELNKEFYDKSIDPQLIMASIALLDRGIIADSDLRDTLRKSGMIEREDEEIIAEAESASPIDSLE